MACKVCAAGNQAEFNAQVDIPFTDKKSLARNITPVSVFSKILVCLDCGFAEFAVPEAGLKQLAEAALVRESVTVEAGAKPSVSQRSLVLQ
jgi:hypothetical protein